MTRFLVALAAGALMLGSAEAASVTLSTGGGPMVQPAGPPGVVIKRRGGYRTKTVVRRGDDDDFGGGGCRTVTIRKIDDEGNRVTKKIKKCN